MSAKIFFCYTHEDEPLLNKLKTHLKSLQRLGLIRVWYDREISPGAEWEQEINKHLFTAQVVLLLVSPDFIASDYCYGTEMKRAIELHELGRTYVIPIILRPSYWQDTPLSKFQVLPSNGRPVTSWTGRDGRDRALLDVTMGIKAWF